MACAAACSLGFVGISGGPSPPLPQSHQASHRWLPLLVPKKTCKGVTRRGIACNGGSRVTMSAASFKEKNLSTLAALALTTALVVPEMAEAVAPGVSPSLKNLLLSVVAGGVVLGVIGVAVAGVSTFDPVKRS
ncbi:hypothetical protein O6H91_11G050200 [Diphasiastrum complanatum]|uniref:Uncharacterized protein n=1 Tax=Diphasiastrum complanatum TaxID=34168 RepID=A0ACC2C912_DIPCM|nr:hypothetical protein O6H91_11G050200 [Diphasiastrum complanatum]